MKLATYIIGQRDTIELLAQILLRDSNQERTLIELNKLRYPYISDDPVDQFANLKGTVLLVGSYTDPTSLTINNVNSINIMPNDTIYLQEASNTGSSMIQSVSNSTLTLTNSIMGSFDQGAIAYVFGNQENVTTNVLKTGDVLYYPFISGSTLNGTTDYSYVLGTDVMLDQNNFIHRYNGDVMIVSGLDNLAQSLTMRLQTYVGGLMLHPEYGNQLYEHLGEAGKTYFSGLARYYVMECVSQDPRVQSVDVSDFYIEQDQVFIVLNIVPIGTQDTVNINVNFNMSGGM